MAKKPPASTVTQVGLVYYGSDPSKRIIRRIFPTKDDSEITDELCQCKHNNGQGCGELGWSAHLDKTKNPILVIVSKDSQQASAPVITGV